MFYFQLRTDFNLLLMNLIMTELLVSLIGIPVDALASAQGGWNMGATLCRMVGFLLTTLGEFFYTLSKKKKKQAWTKIATTLTSFPQDSCQKAAFDSMAKYQHWVECQKSTLG